MAKRFKVYMTRDEVAELPKMSNGERPDDRFKLVQERDWDAYLATLAPKRVTSLDVQRLAQRFNKSANCGV
jgi:hypothetical protein